MESLMSKLKDAGLDDNEIMFYYEVNALARSTAKMIPELRVGEQADYVKDFQNILTRLLARSGLRAIGHKPSSPVDAVATSKRDS